VRNGAELAVIVSSYQRAWHLERVLASIAVQRNVLDRIELIVTDDGSTDETPQVVDRFARSVSFPVRFLTHQHEGFQLSRIRNDGARLARAEYLLFIDADCALPPDHLEQHLRARRQGFAWSTECYRFDQQTTQRVDLPAVCSGRFLQWIPADQRRTLTFRGYKRLLYQLLHHPTKPRLFGGNFALWRSDYERVNGFDENFRGWGCEDDDLRLRLRRAGIRSGSLLLRTRTVHLWHPPDPSVPARWREGLNVAYMNRPIRLTRCANGLVKRSIDDLRFSLSGRPADAELLRRFLGERYEQLEQPGRNGCRPEIELLVVPGRGRFSGRADCNMLVVFQPVRYLRRLLRQAHVVLTNTPLPEQASPYLFGLDELDAALETVLAGSRD